MVLLSLFLVSAPSFLEQQFGGLDGEAAAADLISFLIYLCSAYVFGLPAPVASPRVLLAPELLGSLRRGCAAATAASAGGWYSRDARHRGGLGPGLWGAGQTRAPSGTTRILP